MMTIEQLTCGVKQYGTPLYVFDQDETKKTVSDLREQTNQIAKICFAMKSNPFLTKQMARLTDRIEVCSMGEYEICRAVRVSPEKLFISGVLKKEEDLERILGECKGASVYSVESEMQFRFFEKWSRAHEETLRLYLRLTSGNQFGMDLKTIKDIIASGKEHPFIEITGIHYFSGTQKKNPAACRKELSFLSESIREIEESCLFKIENLEYGPGLAVPYFVDRKDCRQESLDHLCRAIREFKLPGEIILEMGRFLVGSAGYYLTKVSDLKKNGSCHYCIVDGGIHQVNYDGQIRGMYRPFIQVIPERESADETEWTICGSLCTDSDVLAGKISLPALRCGDVLVFHRTGAYAMTEGMALFLSHSLPKAAVFDGMNGWRLIRHERPTWIWNMDKEVFDGSTDESFNGN